MQAAQSRAGNIAEGIISAVTTEAMTAEDFDATIYRKLLER